MLIPSSRASFGLPRVNVRAWIGALFLIQVSYVVLYPVVQRATLRLFDDPLGCSMECVGPQFVLLMDWFISSASVLVAMISDALVFDELVIFSYHYIYFIRIFLFYRLIFLSFFLPARGVPAWLAGFVMIAHTIGIATLLRIFYVLLAEIEKSKSHLIALQITFKRLFLVTTVKVFRHIEGDSTCSAPAFSITRRLKLSDVCPICYEALSIGSLRSLNSASRSRLNIVAARPLLHGKLDVFTTSCNHSFHRACIMKVCY